METYDKYKPSGIDWIGEVPEHWEKCRLKNVLRENLMYGANESAECDNPNYPRYIRITDMTDDGKLRDETFKSLEPIKANPYLLKCGDMLFARSGATVGKTFLFEMDIVACFAGYLIKASFNTTVLPKYVFYYTQSGIYDNWKNSVFIQATIQNIGADKYANMPFIRPSIEEQNKIVAFLDARCADIDKVVATQQKRIALLQELKQSEITQAVTRGLNPDARMKDSGVEWIGCVPEHWEVRRLKHLCEIFGRIGFRGYTEADLVSESEGAITLSPSNFTNGKLDFSKCSYLSWEKYYESPEIMIENGDVIFVKTASVGKCAIVTDLPKEATLNPQIVVFKKMKCDGRFLNYVCQTPVIQSQVITSLNGSTISTISQEKIGSYRLALPKMVEQAEIVEYLDRRCGEIDKQIGAVTKQIELLREYKQALITEVVTGKRKV